MKSKKLFLTLIAVLMVCTMAFAFAACDKTPTEDPVDPNNNGNTVTPGGETEVSVADKINSAIASVGTTIDAVANSVKEGKLDAALSITAGFTMGDEIDLEYTLGTQASVDLFNAQATDKAIVYVNDKNNTLMQLYFEEEGAADGIMYVTVGDFKRAINVGNVTDMLALYGFTQSFFEYSDFATMTGFDLATMWEGLSGTVAAILPEKLDKDGYIALDKSLTSIAANMLPTLLTGMGVDVDGLPAMLGLKDTTFADLMKFVNLELRTDVTTSKEGYLSGLVLEIGITKGDSEKIPADFNLPPISVKLAIALDISAQTINAGITKADYTEIHALNGILEGEIKLINNDQTSETYTYSLKADMDPMAILNSERVDFNNFQLTDAILENVGVLEAVLKDGNGKVVAEAFYNSKVNKNLAFAFINYDFKGADESFAHYCTFDVQKLVAFSNLATNLSREYYAGRSIFDDEETSFDISAIMGYLGMAKAYIDPAKEIFAGIQSAFVGNTLVLDWEKYNAAISYLDDNFGPTIVLLYSLLTYDGTQDAIIIEDSDDEIDENDGLVEDEDLDAEDEDAEDDAEDLDAEDEDAEDDDEYIVDEDYEMPTLSDLLADVPAFIKKLFGQNIAAIEISLNTQTSGYGVLDINSEAYTALFRSTNQANITDKYYANVAAVVPEIRVAFGGELPTEMKVSVTNLAGETEEKAATVSAWSSFNSMALGEQIVYFVADFADDCTVMIPFPVKVTVYATEIGEIEISEEKTAAAEGIYTAVVGQNVIEEFGLTIVVDGKIYDLNKSEISCAGLNEYGEFAAVGTYDLTASIAGKTKTVKVVVADLTLNGKLDYDTYKYTNGDKFEAKAYVDGKEYNLLPSEIVINGKTVRIPTVAYTEGAISAGINGSAIANAAEVSEPSTKAKKTKTFYAGVSEDLAISFSLTNNKLNEPIISDEAGLKFVTLTFTSKDGYVFSKQFTVWVDDVATEDAE